MTEAAAIDTHPEWAGKTASEYELAVRIDTRADGPIVVLLHGLNSDATDWQPVIDDFPMEYRIIAVDLLGYGESPRPMDIDYSDADHVAAIHTTLSKLDLEEPFLLVGYSLGGDIALNYAATHPEQVRRLFLLSAPFYLPADEFESKGFSFHFLQQTVEEWAWRLVRSAPDDFTKLFNRIDTAGTPLNKIAAGVMRDDDVNRAWTIMGKQLDNAIQGVDFPGNLPKITMPAVFALGVRDPIVRQDLVPPLRRLKPEMEIRRIPGLNANHFMLLNIPDVVAAEVMKDEVSHLHFPHRFGAGEPMAFLHGQGASSQYWIPFSDALATRYDTAIVDLLGFGKSPKPLSFAYTLSDHVRLLRATLFTRFSRRPLRLVGQGMGSVVALGYAARYPDEVADLVLFDTPVLLSEEQRKRFPGADVGAATAEQLQDTITAVRARVSETLDKDYVSQIGGDAYELRAIPAMRSVDEVVGKQDIPGLLDRIQVPVKFVYGDSDPAVVPQFIEALAAAYDNVTTVATKGSRGNLPITSPEMSLDQIDDQLKPEVVQTAVKASKTNKWWVGGASAVQLLQSADLTMLVRGVLMLIAGLALVYITGIPIHNYPARILALFAAGWVLLESAQTIIGAIGLRSGGKAWLSFGLIGVVGIFLGLFLLINTKLSVGLILLVLGIRAAFTGVFDLIVAWRVGGGPQKRWLLAAEGLLQLAFAGLVFFTPGHGSKLVVYLLEAWLIVSGAWLLLYAWQSRRIARRVTNPKFRGA